MARSKKSSWEDREMKTIRNASTTESPYLFRLVVSGQIKLLFTLFFQLLFASTICFGQTNSFFLRAPQVAEWTPEIERISFLLRNKAFLDTDATDEAITISKNLSRADNEALLGFYRVYPGLFLSPPNTKFVFSPLYEDMAPKYTWFAVGVVGTGLFLYATMIGTYYDNHLVNGVEGTVGFSMSLSALVYFIGLPIWEPNAYEMTTVNRKLVDILIH
jgi:hypothetical protein